MPRAEATTAKALQTTNEDSECSEQQKEHSNKQVIGMAFFSVVIKWFTLP